MVTLPRFPPSQVDVLCVHDISSFAWNNAVAVTNITGTYRVDMDHHGLLPYGTLWSNINTGSGDYEGVIGSMRGPDRCESFFHSLHPKSPVGFRRCIIHPTYLNRLPRPPLPPTPFLNRQPRILHGGRDPVG